MHSEGSDCVFGGYAGKAWASSGDWQKDAAANTSSLFALKDTMGFAPCTMTRKTGDTYPMFCDSSSGPWFGSTSVFGGVGSLVLGNPMNNDTGSYPCTHVDGVSYNLPSGAPKPYYMAGTTEKFAAAELEVFGLQ